MSKILIGMAAAALWFVFSQAANAERVCRQVCDSGTCVSRCVDQPDQGVIIRDQDREHDRLRDHERGPGVELRAPDVGVEIGR
jgi:hypothetical protein